MPFWRRHVRFCPDAELTKGALGTSILGHLKPANESCALGTTSSFLLMVLGPRGFTPRAKFSGLLRAFVKINF
jgi:hypothetical protein